MRPTDHLLTVTLAVGPAVGVPLHGGSLHGTQLHVLVDSLLGLVVGIVLVAVYLGVLRHLHGPGGSAGADGARSDTDLDPETSSSGRESGNS